MSVGAPLVGARHAGGLKAAAEGRPRKPGCTARTAGRYSRAVGHVDVAAVRYDRAGDAHYDMASALIKSMRGSDVDAALHYLARMIVAGEDPRFIVRRIIIFASEDYSVTTANDGENALAKIRERRPDLVLADVVMPRKNGYELCEAVKNDPDNVHYRKSLGRARLRASDAPPYKRRRLLAPGLHQEALGGLARREPVVTGRPRGVVGGRRGCTHVGPPVGSACGCDSSPPAVAPPPRPSAAPPHPHLLPGLPTVIGTLGYFTVHPGHVRILDAPQVRRPRPPVPASENLAADA